MEPSPLRRECPSFAAGEEPGAGDGGLGLGDIASAAGDVFKNDAPPKGREAVVYGASLSFGSLGPLPPQGLRRSRQRGC